MAISEPLTRRRRWIRRSACGAALGAVALVVLAFPFGPLLPWSPWKPGYDHLALKRADVYYPAGTTPPAPFKLVDQYIEEAEAFHGLTAGSRIRVILCPDWGAFRRHLPQYRSHGVGAVMILTGTALYVSPRVAERGFDHGEFIRHEVSHGLLNQNQTLWQAFRARRTESFFEGLAVSFGRQRAYVPTSEALDWIRANDVAPLFAPARAGSGQPRRMRLNYVVWRLFVEYLRETGGPDRFHALLQAMMQNPEGYSAHLARVYGRALDAMLARFQDAVRSGTWTGSTRS